MYNFIFFKYRVFEIALFFYVKHTIIKEIPIHKDCQPINFHFKLKYFEILKMHTKHIIIVFLFYEFELNTFMHLNYAFYRFIAAKF